jgi:hypothetical protein
MFYNISAALIFIISFLAIAFINVTSSLGLGGHLLFTLIDAIILIIGIGLIKNGDKTFDENSEIEPEDSEEK